MAPIEQQQCIFVHIPKTAGVSIATALYGSNCGGHETLVEYSWIYPETVFRELFKFTFVRNPWDRLLSAWRFLKSGGTEAYDRVWFEKNLARYESFDAFVRQWVTPDNVRKYMHFVPQFEYLRLAGVGPEVDFIGRFERVDEDFARLTRLLGVERQLPHLNRTPGDRVAYVDAYSTASRDIAAQVYATDIEQFGYQFGH